MKTVTGFLLSSIKFGDSDAVLHCFTKEEGFLNFFAKGIFSSKNKQKSYLQPLSELSFQTKNSKRGSLLQLTRIEAINVTESNDIKASAIYFFVCDFLNQVLKNESENTNLYAAISEIRKELSLKNYSAHLVFMILILKYFGIAPLLSENHYLDPIGGNFKFEMADKLFPADISKIWKTILAEETLTLKVSPELRPALLASILSYYQFHFSGFKTPDSLEIIRQFW